MLLTPRLVAQLGRHQLVPRRRVRGRFVGGHRSSRLGASVEFADVREYVAGDDPRRIDLSASRRHGRLQVTLTEAEDDASAQVVLDRSASMYGPKRRVADQIAAGLSVLGARDGVRLWLAEHDPLANADRLGGGWTRGSGALAHAGLLLQGTGGAHVPGTQATTGQTVGASAAPGEPTGDDDFGEGPAGRPDLTAAVGRAARATASGPLVLISDLLYDDWDATIRALGSGRLDVLVLQVLDVEELRPHLLEDVRLVDAETGAEVQAGGDEGTVAAYAEALRTHLDAVEAACTTIGAAHVLVPTDVDLARLLLAELPALGLVR
ncbi:DUF58 domain-containing protein [Egicoccus sp. AB-alg6-2]|uniref:DUF58 domain-containing protein n=1 Tax=Egicoccus sp. AB-alg6-2 TaxID=3242692 RepID=UPI00359D152A